MNKEYLIRGNQICFVIKNELNESISSGVFFEDSNGPEKQEYLSWVAEGNEATLLEKKGD
jgi:hypothetical protein